MLTPSYSLRSTVANTGFSQYNGLQTSFTTHFSAQLERFLRLYLQPYDR